MEITIINYIWFLIAAFLEIAGCYAFWVWVKRDQSVLWLFPGIISLVLFAIILTKVENEIAGRAYAAYGGIYIITSLFWMSYIENEKISMWDYLGTTFCLLGATIIVFGASDVEGLS